MYRSRFVILSISTLLLSGCLGGVDVASTTDSSDSDSSGSPSGGGGGDMDSSYMGGGGGGGSDMNGAMGMGGGEDMGSDQMDGSYMDSMGDGAGAGEMGAEGMDASYMDAMGDEAGMDGAMGPEMDGEYMDGAMGAGGPGMDSSEMEGYGAGMDGGEMGADYGLDGGGGDYGPGMNGGAGRGNQPKSYQEMVTRALEQGNDADAIKYSIADGLTNDSSEVFAKFRWVPALKSPSLAVRWGIGVNYMPARGFNGDPRAIGTGLQKVAGRGGRGGEGGGAMGMDEGGMGMEGMGMDGGMGMGGGGADPTAELYKLTGDIGRFVVDEIKSRISSGKYGELLANAPQADKRKGGGAPGMDMGMGGGMGMEGMGMEGGYGMDGGGSGGGRRRGRSNAKPITAGISYLGKGDPKQLKELAEEEGIHVLMIFDVKVGRHPRSGIVINATKADLIDVKSGKSLGKARELTNTKVEQSMAKREDKSVANAYGRLMETADETFKTTDLPAILEQYAAPQVKKLAGDAGDNVLPVLSDAKLYHSRQWLTDDDLVGAYTQLLGVEDGTKLATGDEIEKHAVVAKLVGLDRPLVTAEPARQANNNAGPRQRGGNRNRDSNPTAQSGQPGRSQQGGVPSSGPSPQARNNNGGNVPSSGPSVVPGAAPVGLSP